MKSTEITQPPGRLLITRFPPEHPAAAHSTVDSSTAPDAAHPPHAAVSFTSLPYELIMRSDVNADQENDRTNFLPAFAAAANTTAAASSVTSLPTEVIMRIKELLDQKIDRTSASSEAPAAANSTADNGPAPRAEASFNSLSPQLIMHIASFLHQENDKVNFAVVNQRVRETLPGTRAELLSAFRLASRLNPAPSQATLPETVHDVIEFLSRPNPACATADRPVLNALQQLVNNPEYWRQMPLKIRLALKAPLKALCEVLRTTKTASESLRTEVTRLKDRLMNSWFADPGHAGNTTWQFGRAGVLGWQQHVREGMRRSPGSPPSKGHPPA